jgi:hypothetical protein
MEEEKKEDRREGRERIGERKGRQEGRRIGKKEEGKNIKAGEEQGNSRARKRQGERMVSVDVALGVCGHRHLHVHACINPRVENGRGSFPTQFIGFDIESAK